MRTLLAFTAAAFLLLGSGPALAGGGYASYGFHYSSGGHGHHGHRHHRHGRHHGHGAYYLLGGLIGGLILADVLSRPRYYPVPVYAPPRARYDCKPTTGTGYRYGRPALFGGTFCYDVNGVGYVVPGSEYFIGYQ